MSVGFDGGAGDVASGSPDGAQYPGDDAPGAMADNYVAMSDGTVQVDTGVQDAGGSPPMDAPPDVPSCTSCAIELKYKCQTTAAMSQ